MTADVLFDVPVLVDGELVLYLVDRTVPRPERNLAPTYNFEIRIAGDKVGNISLRVGNTDLIERYAGHIGYGVDVPRPPPMRPASSTATSRPSLASSSAVMIPVKPPPTTATSTSRSR